MQPSYLAIDVGNTTMKWGVFRGLDLLFLERLPLGDHSAWEKCWHNLELSGHPQILLSGVVPKVQVDLLEWFSSRGILARIITYKDLPFPTQVDAPEKTGIDRLLSGYAGIQISGNSHGVVTVNVGSAVTVDLTLKSDGFQGGAIFPGFQLMSKALHANTAQLPEINVPEVFLKREGKNTFDAISYGVGQALLGGIRNIVNHYLQTHPGLPIFVSGGDGELVARELGPKYLFQRELVLLGLAYLSRELLNV
ncbi:MAG: Type pantothenate kinase [Planctomycetota bacterium]